MLEMRRNELFKQLWLGLEGAALRLRARQARPARAPAFVVSEAPEAIEDGGDQTAQGASKGVFLQLFAAL